MVRYCLVAIALAVPTEGVTAQQPPPPMEAGFSADVALELLPLVEHAREKPGDTNLPLYWQHLCRIGTPANPRQIWGFVAISGVPDEPGTDVRFAVVLASPPISNPNSLGTGRPRELVPVNYTVGAPQEARITRAVRDILSTVVLDDVMDCFKAQPGYHVPFKIYVTGYEVAGAAASVVSLQLKQAYRAQQVKEYTFGAPAGGNPSFARHHFDGMGAGMAFRLMTSSDPYQVLPPFQVPRSSLDDTEITGTGTLKVLPGAHPDPHSFAAYFDALGGSK